MTANDVTKQMKGAGRSMSRDDILCEIYCVIRRANELRDPGAQIICAEDTKLFGPGGGLDSLGLVALILDVEEAINARAGARLVLADEHAVSQRRNPFRDIRSLADEVEARLKGRAYA